MKMTTATSELIMQTKAMVLNEHRPVLCRTIVPKNFYPYLRSKYVLSSDDIELIEHETTTKCKVDKFIDILIKHGEQGFDELVRAIIKEKTQIFLAEKLNKSFERKMKLVHVPPTCNAVNTTNSSLPPSEPSLYSSCEPVEHCNSPEPEADAPAFKPKSEPEKSLPSVSQEFQSYRPYINSVSDLGVDTETLPKPVMPKSCTEKASDSDEKISETKGTNELKAV